MEKDTSQLQLYQHFLSFFLPEGILDFFEPVWMETQSLDSRESNKDILYSSSLHIYLDERDNRPEAQCGPSPVVSQDASQEVQGQDQGPQAGP